MLGRFRLGKGGAVCHLPLATPDSGCTALGTSLASVGAGSAVHL